jgi:type IV fimbrial biogenesis protein FimT
MFPDKEVRMSTKIRGFTLYELLITVLLIALLTSLAVPSFAASMARQRQRVEIDALFHALHLARKESIMRRKVVSLCPSIDGQKCLPGRDWSSGWLMFENTDRDSPPQVDAGEPVLLQHRVSDQVRISANRHGFTLRATFLRATNGTFVFCDPQDRISPKALVVSYTGRPRVARHTTKGELYSCAD